MEQNNFLANSQTRAEIAQKMGVSPQAVHHWITRGIPAEYCPDIELLTGVKCEVMRPDVNWSVLRAKASKRTKSTV